MMTFPVATLILVPFLSSPRVMYAMGASPRESSTVAVVLASVDVASASPKSKVEVEYVPVMLPLPSASYT